MKYDQLIQAVGQLPWFDLPLLTQLSGEPKRQLTTQLHQWTLSGKLLSLRRGLYTLADAYRKARLSSLQLANEMIKPSYLTGLWALSYYGLIPEKVTAFTSVTTRVTREFQNAFGTFAYSSLKTDYFWGFVSVPIEGTQVWIAEPEKAVLDYWHLQRGEWTDARLMEMRFQNTEQLDFEKLDRYAEKWASPRLRLFTERFKKLMLSLRKEYHEI